MRDRLYVVRANTRDRGCGVRAGVIDSVPPATHLLRQARNTRRHGRVGPILFGRAAPVRAARSVRAAAVLLAGAGGALADGTATTPDVPGAAGVTPTASTGISAGDLVQPGRSTPRVVSRAINGRQAVVVAFLMPGAADDDMVASALRQVRSSRGMRTGVRYFVYRLGQASRFGDLPEVLGVTVTPSVAVIGRDRKLMHRWSGLVDADVLSQSISDAMVTPPAFRS